MRTRGDDFGERSPGPALSRGTTGAGRRVFIIDEVDLGLGRRSSLMVRVDNLQCCDAGCGWF